MNRSNLHWLLIVALVGSAAAASAQTMYRYVDPTGRVVYSDQPPPPAAKDVTAKKLQENVIERLGSNRAIQLDIRVIAATNLDPVGAVREGKLRDDLYYRINVVSIHLPPLRERTEDSPGLVAHFLAKHGNLHAPAILTPAALRRLAAYRWPGNVRELENTIERALILGSGRAIDENDFALADPGGNPADPEKQAEPQAVRPLNEAVGELEARLIRAALTQAQDNKAKAAALLDISERTLWYKLKRLRPEQDGG